MQLASQYGDENHESIEIIQEDGRSGFIVDVTKLPKYMSKLEFVISW